MKEDTKRALIEELQRGYLQTSIETLPNNIWDVVIVGAGPAGSTAAVHLASMGHRVLLLDRHRFPREKPCGDALVMDAIRCLHNIGILDQVKELGFETDMSCLYSPSGYHVELRGTFIILKRYYLDFLIAKKAVESGAFFCLGTVDKTTIEENGFVTFSIQGSKQVCRAKIGIIATGANLMLANNLGLVMDRQASGVAIRCYVSSSHVINHLVFSYDKSIVPGYAWIFPLGNDEYNVGCGLFYQMRSKDKVNLKNVFRVFIQEFPLAHKLMSKAWERTSFRGGIVRCGLKGVRPLGQGNLLIIGETIGTTFPFSGEGIGKAMETGVLAAETVDNALVLGEYDLLREYPVRLENEVKPIYKAYNIAQNWFTNVLLNDLIVRRAQKSKFFRETFEGIISETIDPRKIFSITGVIKSFWK